MPHRISSHRSGAAVRCGRCRTGCEIHPVASRDEIASMTQTRGCRDFAVTDGYRNPLPGGHRLKQRVSVRNYEGFDVSSSPM
eukprot:scaffold10763_cov57-Phaeocystis_antarctica.AAC.1